MGSNKPRPLDYQGLHDRYMAGESGTAIAESEGIKWSGLYRAWKRLGLPRRSGTDAARLLIAQHPERRDLIQHATNVRRGGTDSMVVREQRARTREARHLGISHHEQVLADLLTARGVSFRQQAAIGPYNVDFAFDDLRITLDVDGGGHNPRVNANRAARTAYIVEQGWTSHRTRTRRTHWIGEVLTLIELLREDRNPI